LTTAAKLQSIVFWRFSAREVAAMAQRSCQNRYSAEL